MIAVTNTSQISGNENTRNINVDPDKLQQWSEGKLTGHIQNIFPELSADDREFLLTGITPEEWNAAFPPEEE